MGNQPSLSQISTRAPHTSRTLEQTPASRHKLLRGKMNELWAQNWCFKCRAEEHLGKDCPKQKVAKLPAVHSLAIDLDSIDQLATERAVSALGLASRTLNTPRSPKWPRSPNWSPSLGNTDPYSLANYLVPTLLYTCQGYFHCRNCPAL